ncbi:Aste57867_20306 [Aphanomyces stellatus]|uniref:Aste57867_20306 protein n=1 Tax=Aphanomyces stellatus TaxID=120398 RepID=A0A485LFE1_9STRA|nr:hypothetical protein As57867_020240 [Aphanomyces stellatus]VFT96995.1 Aste57867_20306 [Aphanomyces stellatus]
MGRIHPVLNVDRLELAKPLPSQFKSRPIPKAAPIILDEATGEQLHIIEAFLNTRTFNRNKEYWVKWHGLDEPTRQLENNVKRVSHFDRLLKTLRDKIAERRAAARGRM